MSDYTEAQDAWLKETGIQEGSLVKVLTAPGKDTWQLGLGLANGNAWGPRITRNIGRVCIVHRIDDDGIQLYPYPGPRDITVAVWAPFWILVKVEDDEEENQTE